MDGRSAILDQVERVCADCRVSSGQLFGGLTRKTRWDDMRRRRLAEHERKVFLYILRNIHTGSPPFFFLSRGESFGVITWTLSPAISSVTSRMGASSKVTRSIRGSGVAILELRL